MQSASNITNSNKYEVVVNKVTVIENNVLTLQSYTVSSGTNCGIGPGVFNDLTTGTQNTAIGNSAAGGPYKLTTGSGNAMVGYNSGGTCEDGSNNTFLGTNYGGARTTEIGPIRNQNLIFWPLANNL